MVPWPQGSAQLGDALLGHRLFRALRKRDSRSVSHQCRPAGRNEDVGGICTMECLGVAFRVKWQILVLGKTCNDARVQLTAESYDADAFRGLDRGSLSEEE